VCTLKHIIYVFIFYIEVNERTKLLYAVKLVTINGKINFFEPIYIRYKIYKLHNTQQLI